MAKSKVTISITLSKTFEEDWHNIGDLKEEDVRNTVFLPDDTLNYLSSGVIFTKMQEDSKDWILDELAIVQE